MISLCLAVLSSTLVSVVMRLSGKRVNHNLGMLAMNYIVCTMLSGAFGGFGGILGQSDPRMGAALAMGSMNGVLYLAGFVLMQLNIRKNGVVLSSIFQKLGLLVPIVISVVCYHEMPDLLQGCGFLLAVAAIFLMNYQKETSNVGSGATLLAMLMSCGFAEAMSKIFTESGAAHLEGQFLFYTFGMAMVLSLVMVVVKRQRIGLQELLFGTMIAVPNFFSSKFILGALEAVPAVIVFPVYSVGSILVVTLAGIGLFAERLTKRQWAAMAAILVALVLLNI